MTSLIPYYLVLPDQAGAKYLLPIVLLPIEDWGEKSFYHLLRSKRFCWASSS